jgi:hypothetical protein
LPDFRANGGDEHFPKNKCLISRPSAINMQMHDAGDMELLREYDRQGSEAAFATLVQRHVSLVYSAALRHIGIAAHAEEITQAVFVILARKAASLRPDTILESWLYETTRLTALSFRRGERRRQFREQEAYMQSTFRNPPMIQPGINSRRCSTRRWRGWGKKTATPCCCAISRTKTCAKSRRR